MSGHIEAMESSLCEELRPRWMTGMRLFRSLLKFAYVFSWFGDQTQKEIELDQRHSLKDPSWHSLESREVTFH